MSLLTEPTRKSIFDVVQYNLRAVNRKIYVTRVVYFGEYHGTPEVLWKKMEGIIRDLRTDYSDMPITGLLLVYPTYYIHVLEAWEDIIYKHYELMYTPGNDKCKFERAIPLPSYHHVNQRFFADWYHAYTVPPTLLTALERHSLDDIQKQISNCLTKVYTLCEYIADALREKSTDVQNVLRKLGGDAARYLPESTVLEFLLNVKSPILRTVEDHLRMYSDVSPCAFWDDNNIWPAPCDLMPRDVFDEHGHRKILSYSNDEK